MKLRGGKVGESATMEEERERGAMMMVKMMSK